MRPYRTWFQPSALAPSTVELIPLHPEYSRANSYPWSDLPPWRARPGTGPHMRRTGVHCTCGLISSCSGCDCVKSLRSSYTGLYHRNVTKWLQPAGSGERARRVPGTKPSQQARSVTLSVATPLYPYGIAYGRVEPSSSQNLHPQST